MKLLVRAVLLCFLLLPASATYGADDLSIDCSSSKEPFAPIICGSSYLSALDRQMTAAYTELARQFTGALLTELKSAQAQWWPDRRTCDVNEDVAICTERHLLDQIAMLQEFKDHPTYDLVPPISDADYSKHMQVFDLFISGNISHGFFYRPTDQIRKQLQAFYNLHMKDIFAVEAAIRGIELRIIEKDYEGALSVIDQIDNDENHPPTTLDQRARILLLKTLAQKHQDTAISVYKIFWIEYCRIVPTCDKRILSDDIDVLNAILQMNMPAPSRRKALASSRLAQVKDDAEVLKAQIVADEEAVRQAEEEERIRIEAAKRAALEARAQEQANMLAQQKAAQDAAEAAKRATAEAEAHQLHRTFRYQAGLIASALVVSVKLIFALVPWWVYPIAAALGWLTHRHLALRITLGLASFAVLAYAAVYASPFRQMLPGGVAELLTTVWQTWVPYDPDISVDRLPSKLAFTYIPLLVIAYLLAIIMVGREVRAAEAYRWAGFVPAWVHAGQYAFAARRQERAEQRRMLRAAKFEAKLAAIQMQGQPPLAGGMAPYPYAYPPPPRGIGAAFRGFFDFSRSVISLFKWAIIAGAIYAFIKYGDRILDKGLLLIDKAGPLANNLLSFAR